MANSWPANIPSAFENAGYSYDPQSGVIRVDMETGPAKQRRRFTAVVKNHKGNILLTLAQFQTWESWFENTIAFGTLPFTMPHPLTGAEITARIVPGESPYKFTPEAGTGRGLLAIEIEALP